MHRGSTTLSAKRPSSMQKAFSLSNHRTSAPVIPNLPARLEFSQNNRCGCFFFFVSPTMLYFKSGVTTTSRAEGKRIRLNSDKITSNALLVRPELEPSCRFLMPADHLASQVSRSSKCFHCKGGWTVGPSLNDTFMNSILTNWRLPSLYKKKMQKCIRSVNDADERWVTAECEKAKREFKRAAGRFAF